jgi:type III pantothenate kinase
VILAVDVGNTETVVGLFDGLEPIDCWRLSTDRMRTADEYAFFMRGNLGPGVGGDRGIPERAIMASVVPVLDRIWEETCRSLGIELTRLDSGAPLPIRLDVDEPGSVGADRIANTLAALELYGRDTVVVDLGTATTFDCITSDGTFRGGVIAPGPYAGIEHLMHRTAKLPKVEIAPPENVIGRTTETCLRSGIFYSIVDAIDGIVARIIEEWQPTDPYVVATGGLAELIGPDCRTVQHVEPFLTLIGLAIADRRLSAP